MKLVHYKHEKHFEELSKWLKFWRWEKRIIPEIFSDIGYLITSEDDKPLCVGWLYTTNSLLSSIEWVVANPYEDKVVVDTGLDFLIECLSQRAIKEGSRMVMTTLKSPALAKRLKGLGFIKSGDSLMQYVRLKWQ